MAKKFRKLVDISKDKFDALEGVRKAARLSGKRVPTIPQLIDEALDMALINLLKRHAQS